VLIAGEDDKMFMTRSLNIMPKTTEQRILLVSKVVMQTAQVPKLLDDAKTLPKISTLWVGHNNVTDDRRTARAIR